MYGGFISGECVMCVEVIHSVWTVLFASGVVVEASDERFQSVLSFLGFCDE